MSKKNFSDPQQQQAQHLLLGALAGGLFGVGTALLLAPKNGKRLRDDLCLNCQEIAKKSGNLKNRLLHQGEEWIESAQQWAKNKDKHSSKGALIAGGITGGLLGATAAFLVLQKKNGDLSSSFHEHVASKASYWIKNAIDALGTIENGFKDHGSEEGETSSETSKIQDALEFANLGVRLFQSFKKRR